MQDDWRPTISLSNLQARAHALTQVRQFFARRDVLEVETPLASMHTVTEPNIDSFIVGNGDQKRYLQTSPEYAMKRLLAAGAPDIFQVCKSFRDGECGQRHNPEFTIIEWYRLDITLEQIMRETVELIEQVIGECSGQNQIKLFTYNEFYEQSVGTSFENMSESDIDQLANEYGLRSSHTLNLAQKIDFVFSCLVNTHIDPDVITCIYHYPVDQAALAKLTEDGRAAERFEMFYGDLELANGYVELIDAEIQLKRFNKDLKVRKELCLEEIPIDHRLLSAQQHGLPSCSGVAVGLDRLLMIALNANHIEQVMSFSWRNA